MSTYTVKFFARLREQIGTASLEVPLEDAATLTALKSYLLANYPHWHGALSGHLLTAVNQTMVSGDQPLKAGDEVAWFPPVTGG